MLSYMLCVAMEPNGDDDSVTPEEFNRPYREFIRTLSAQSNATVSTKELEAVFGTV